MQATLSLTVNTNVSAMTDAELEDYRLLLQELKALLPAEPSPKPPRDAPMLPSG